MDRISYRDNKGLENIRHAKEIQNERKDQIESLRNLITYGDDFSREKQIKNTEKRFIYAEGYLNNNADHMDDESYKNTKERQKNRKEQLDSYR